MAGDEIVDVVAAPNAPLGSADATRRWALSFPDGVVRFPGVTRPEGSRVADVFPALPDRDRPAALVVVVLPVLLSDGAGPHLLDARGRLVLAVAEHDAGTGLRVALGPEDPADVGGTTIVGLVREFRPGVWTWRVRARAPGDRRVAALDDLDDIRDEAGFTAWQHRWE